MTTSIESRLWLAVHLLYPNSSQAFDVYQAVVLQSEEALAKDNRALVFSKLAFVFEKIAVISTNLSFYEFEYAEIDQWKIIYKNSQKPQLLIFVGVLIFELKIREIAPCMKLSQEKAQFLFHQMFKKLAQNSSKIKYNEQLNFKKQNDLKVSYLFTYENLIEYCLEQLPAAETEKVKIGLELYPILQTTKDEYLKIISQIQNLKVQKSNSVLSKPKSKTKIALVKSDVAESGTEDVTKDVRPAFYKNKKIISVVFIAVVAVPILFQLVDVYNYFGGIEKTVVIQQIDKKPEFAVPRSEIALESLPKQPEATAPAQVGQNMDHQSGAEPSTVALSDKTHPKAVDSVARGGLYRGSLIVKNLVEDNKKLIAKIAVLGAKKAGEVELGWLKSNGVAYYHFTMPVENIEEANRYLKQLGALDIKFEAHPRLIPAGRKRFIIEVKGE